MRYAYLIKVNANANNNKFYEMTERADGTFLAEWGRVEGTHETMIYPMSKWNSVYNTRIKHGYVDKTTERSVPDSSNVSTNPFTGFAKTVFADILAAANGAINRNYTAAKGVTLAMVQSAQNILDRLTILHTNLDEYNSLLVELYTTIPRKMKKVSDHLARNLTEVRELVAHEQELLDTLAASVSTVEPKGETVQYNFKLEDCDPNEIFRGGLDFNRKLRAVKVIRDNEPQLVNPRYLWHGSGMQNWHHILKEGLRIRPATAVLSGSAFGYGIYFADYFNKSVAYCRGGKYIAVAEVELGNMLRLRWGDTSTYTMTYDDLRKRGQYDSVFGDKSLGSLMHNEYIVYRECQQRIKYIMEV